MNYNNIKTSDIKEVNSHCSLGIITAGTEYLFQVRTPDYPVEPFVGTLSLFGGNWTTIDDKSPYDTLIRELEEEIENLEVKKISSFGDYYLYTPESVTKTKDYPTYASVFEAQVEIIEDGIDVKEGSKKILTINELQNGKETFSWGHEIPLGDYLKDKGIEMDVKTFRGIEGGRIVDGDPMKPYKERIIDNYKVNPLRESQTDRSPFE